MGEKGTARGVDAGVLAAALVDTVRGDAHPSFMPLYDRVYVAVRNARDRHTYADALSAGVARAIADACALDDVTMLCHMARMLADVLAPARHALGLGPEAFAALLVPCTSAVRSV